MLSNVQSLHSNIFSIYSMANIVYKGLGRAESLKASRPNEQHAGADKFAVRDRFLRNAKIGVAGLPYRSLELLTGGLYSGDVPALGAARVAPAECFATVEKEVTSELESDSARVEVHNNSGIIPLAT